jgi:hypothetical protein
MATIRFSLGNRFALGLGALGLCRCSCCGSLPFLRSAFRRHNKHPLSMFVFPQGCGGPQKLRSQSRTPDNIHAAPVAFTFRNGVGDVVSQSRRAKPYFGAHSAIWAGNLNRSAVSHDGPVAAPPRLFSFAPAIKRFASPPGAHWCV